MTELTCTPAGQTASRITIEQGCRTAAYAACTNRDFVVCDARVRELHDPRCQAAAGTLELGGGETAKTFAGLERITRTLASSGIDRNGRVFAIGGGTIGDAAGFAAATYLRGIELVQIPTTLLAMVDSSVGGKTAINLDEGKNLVGAFWPPSRVFIDPEFLTTLPEAEFRSGLGEVLKIAIGLDADLFRLCEDSTTAILQRDPAAVASAIHAAVAAKIRVVEADFREASERKLLNLGHTMGHAIEADSGFRIAHGIAVARGIHFAIDLAERFEELTVDDATRCRQLLEKLGFHADPLPDHARLAPFFARDKKRRGGNIDWVIPTAIGHSKTRSFELGAALI